MVEKLKETFASRKFWVAMFGCALTFINGKLQIMSDADLVKLLAMLGTWILGQSVVDAKK